MDIDDPPQFPPSPLESSFTHPSPSPVPVIVENRAAARWLQLNPAIPATRLCADPPIYAVENFLTPEECQLLISAGAPGLSRSIVVDAKDGKSPAPSRTSESCYLLKSSTEWLHARVAALTGMPSVTHEPPQIARYTPNQFYLAHWDAFDITSSSGVECVATGGQRICTVLIYLNDVASGADRQQLRQASLCFSITSGTEVFQCSCLCLQGVAPFSRRFLFGCTQFADLP